MSRPKHGEPDHVCPGDQIIEWRATASELALYLQGLTIAGQQVQAAHLMAQIVGDAKRVVQFEEVYTEIYDAHERLFDWAERFTLELQKEDAEEWKRQEFNVEGH